MTEFNDSPYISRQAGPGNSGSPEGTDGVAEMADAFFLDFAVGTSAIRLKKAAIDAYPAVYIIIPKTAA